MSPTTRQDTYTTALRLSREFFERSTRVLDEADSKFRPTPGTMTVAQQVAHVATTIDWFVQGASRPEGFDLDFEKHAKELESVESLQQARELLNSAYDNVERFVASKSPEELAQPLPDGPVMGGRPAYEIFGAIVEHTAHHRGALTVYSRLLGKVPLMPYGE